MSSAGHVMDMINRVKQNMALKNNRRNRFNKVKEVYLNELSQYKMGNNLSKQNISDKELVVVKNKIRAKLQAEKRRNVIIATIVIVLVGSFLAYYFLAFYNQNNINFLKY